MASGNRTALKYMLLPGILPRVGKFFSSGFSHAALYMACVFRAVRLLPAGHPYLSIDNTGRFGIRHVLAEARRNLIFKRENADQVIIYYTLLAGVFLLFLQFAMLGISLMSHAAHATIVTTADLFGRFGVFGMFDNIDVSNDIAFILLDYIFGVQGMFVDSGGGTTCLAANTPCFGSAVSAGAWPTQWHRALHTLFQFYNLGILAVGVIIFLYLVTTVVAETVESGTPFGQRFNRAWAPVRMILALALLALIPYGSGGGQFGLNVAQLLTLHVAGWGSNLATNGWNAFNVSLNASSITPMGTPDTLVVRPNPPQFNTFLEFMFVAHTCIRAEEWANNRTISFYQVRSAIPSSGIFAAAQNMPNNVAAALAFSNGGSIRIRVGEYDTNAYPNEIGYVSPVCGEFILPVKVSSCPGILPLPPPAPVPAVSTNPGACRLMQEYYDMLYFMTTDTLYQFDGDAAASLITPGVNRNPLASVPNAVDFKADYIDYYNDQIVAAIDAARTAQIADPTWLSAITAYGWGGAGIWYNRVAQHNGTFVGSAYSLPVPVHYPAVMEHVQKERHKALNFDSPQERYNPSLPGDRKVEFKSPGDMYTALLLYNAQRYWRDLFELPKGNFFADTVVSLFGLEGLYNMRDNRTTHPMAQMTGIGRGLVESAVNNLMVAFGSGIFGGIANIAGAQNVATVGMGAAGVMGQIGLIGLGLGFVLAYIIPMMPFLYFFFALGIWVKAVFEAMVAMPLWALAHVRIDGEGIPGSAALDGYYLLFEILLRPILVVFGLVTGIIIFSAEVFVLHEIWQLVLSNLTGYDLQTSAAASASGYAAIPAAGSSITGSPDYMRGTVSGFFYTVLYAIVVYMMGNSSFKLIDILPDHILRWMGAGVSSFGEIVKDPAENLVGYSFMFTQAVTGKISEGLHGMDSLVGRNR